MEAFCHVTAGMENLVNGSLSSVSEKLGYCQEKITSGKTLYLGNCNVC